MDDKAYITKLFCAIPYGEIFIAKDEFWIKTSGLRSNNAVVALGDNAGKLGCFSASTRIIQMSNELQEYARTIL